MFWRREKDHETRSFSTIMKNEQIHLYHTWHGYQTTRLPLGTIQLHSRFGLIFTDRQACPCSCVPTQLGGCWQRRVTASVPVCFGRGSGSHMWMKLTKPNQWSLHKSSDVINGLIKCSLYIFFFFTMCCFQIILRLLWRVDMPQWVIMTQWVNRLWLKEEDCSPSSPSPSCSAILE